VAAIRELQGDPVAALAMGLRGRRALERSYSLQRACERWRTQTLELAAMVVPA
jgi:hypothetical protein